MSLLVEEGQVKGYVPAGARLPARSRRRAGEPRRPPTRGRVVAGRGRGFAPDCAPRRVPPRWPWLAAAAVAVGLIITGLGVFADGMSRAVPERTATASVGQGQTLWDLARQYAPDSDPAAVVARIRQLNGLGDAAVVPGQPLTVPAGSRAGGPGQP
ncbi:MAG TPA: LysM peptidoglycan-binding domain-containing protein [Amycolatopsis sp.]|uniref:LysM peptidoglycan-binding domain-containing protein n=1 Tax=Amycolatopsis sp. TaxID=37632 RepID=UPI002B468798|nr:LysM peptidoglycan-binding domain-containing protein [Amycolatopsis sp.]HKS48679.1 LysM peptidoglycan-binding domain-containing protein [Amycolatopsis sp.]